MIAKARPGLAGFILVFVSSAPLWADLYTLDVLSLEWLVDSSDAIYCVRLEKSSASEGNLASCDKQALKSSSAVANQVREVVDQWRSPSNARDGDEYLLFVRTWDHRPPTVVRNVNLTRPLERPSQAAITSEGVPLSSKESILRAVKSRLKLGRRLSKQARQVRDKVDKAIPDVRHSDVPVENRLGGFGVAISCDLWDNPPSDDKHAYQIPDMDTELGKAIVPADKRYYQSLLRSASSVCASGETAKPQLTGSGEAILALVNYPGEETEHVLRRIQTCHARYSDAARRVRQYLHYHEEISGPVNDELLGRWRLVGRQEIIDLTLDDDGTFTASGFDRLPPERGGMRWSWKGRGRWTGEDNQLSLFRREVGLEARDGTNWISNFRVIFEDKPIKQVLPSRVVLEQGPPMIRRQGEGSE